MYSGYTPLNLVTSVVDSPSDSSPDVNCVQTTLTPISSMLRGIFRPIDSTNSATRNIEQRDSDHDDRAIELQASHLHNTYGLPAEVWLAIFELVNQSTALCPGLRNVSQVCRLFRHLTRELLKDRPSLLELSSPITLRDFLKPGTIFWFWGEGKVELRYGLRIPPRWLVLKYWKLCLGQGRFDPWAAFYRHSDIRKLECAVSNNTTTVPRAIVKLMCALPHLETLLLKGCTYDRIVHQFICHCPSLKHLTLVNYIIPSERSIQLYPSTSTSLTTLIVSDHRAGNWGFASRAESELNTLLLSLPLSKLQHLHMHTKGCHISERRLGHLAAVLDRDTLLTVDVACMSIAYDPFQELLLLQTSITKLTIACWRALPFSRNIEGLFPSLNTLDIKADIPIPTDEELRHLTSVQLRGPPPVTKRILDRMIWTAQSFPIALRHLKVTLAETPRQVVQRILASFPSLVTFEVCVRNIYLPKGLVEWDVSDALYNLQSLQRLAFDGVHIISYPDLSLRLGPEEGRIAFDAQQGLMLEWGRRCDSLQMVVLGTIEWVRIEAEEWKAYAVGVWDTPLPIDAT